MPILPTRVRARRARLDTQTDCGCEGRCVGGGVLLVAVPALSCSCVLVWGGVSRRQTYQIIINRQ